MGIVVYMVLYVSSRLKLEIFIVFYGQNSVWKWIPWFYNVGYDGKILVTQIPGSQAMTVSKLVGGLHCMLMLEGCGYSG